MIKKYSLSVLILLLSFFVVSCNEDSKPQVESESSYNPIATTDTDDDGLIAYYAFNDKDTLEYDSTDSGYMAYLTDIDYYDKGKYGGCANFSKNSSFIALSYKLFTYDSITFSAWIYPNSVQSWQRVISIGDTNNSFFITIKNNDNGLCGYKFKSDTSNEYSAYYDTPLKANTWYHIAFTFDDKVAKLYINGEIVCLTPDISQTFNDYYYTSFYLGKSQYNNNPNFYGYMDEVYLFKKALNAESIKKLYNNEFIIQ